MYRRVLIEELSSSLGCTEPVAMALCVADAKAQVPVEQLSKVSSIDVYLSGNMIKNAHAVVVPNAGGMRGMLAAIAVSYCGGQAELGLEVLRDVTPDQLEEAKRLMTSGKIQIHHATQVDKVYIRVEIHVGDISYISVIEREHQRIAYRIVDGKHRTLPGDDLTLSGDDPTLPGNDPMLPGDDPKVPDPTKTTSNTLCNGEAVADPGFSFHTIMDYVDALDFHEDSELQMILDRQIEQNRRIAEVGMTEKWGSCVGQAILASGIPCTNVKVCAYTAAASDARMAGAPYPVVINSGSGNQGVTVSVPLIVYAQEQGIQGDKLYRALVLSNLIGIYIKSTMEKLSAFCGAISAAAGAGAGLAYLQDYSRVAIGEVISMVLLNVGGTWCDGAKSSCAAKIASGIQSALLALGMVSRNHVFACGEGLCDHDVDATIRNVGKVAQEGMQLTDDVIINILGNTAQ